MATNDSDAVMADAPVEDQNQDTTTNNNNGDTDVTAAVSAKKRKKAGRELKELADFNHAPPTTTSTTLMEEAESRRSRRRSSTTTPSVTTTPSAPPQQHGNSSKKKKTAKQQEQLDMSWICVDCRQAECAMDINAELMVCEGPCQRLFHPPCAGLNGVPPEDVSWKCHDCTNGRHLCGFCQEYGVDGVDVFPCQKDVCGWFFHQACLEMNGISYDTREEDGVLKFTCPKHWCWTCTQEDLKLADEKRMFIRPSKSKKNKGNSLFAAKTKSRLFSCMECPISYHLTCIPPPAKFHELAMLCHEHADKAELPPLDLESSYQGSVEKRCDLKLQKLRNWDTLLAKRAKGKQLKLIPSKNPFLPKGVVADKRTTREQFVLGKLGTRIPTTTNNSAAGMATDWMCSPTSSSTSDRTMFCLPADVQEEVHSKPPLYKHIHALKYYPENKPKRLPMSKDVCNCTDTCDDHCLNRLLYVECFGNGKGTNCRLGGTNCGNRQLGQRLNVKKCKPKREKGKGWGLVTLEAVPRGKLVQEYLGDVIDNKEKERRLQTWNLEHPNDPNYYIMCLSQGWYVDARETANMARFINHSCDPNCILTRVNVGGFMRDGIFALRDIQPGEFLSYDYHFDTSSDKFVCRCGAKTCRGTMKETNVKGDASGKSNKTKSQLWTEAKQGFEKDEKFLQQLEERAQQNATISAVLPGTASQVPRELGSSIKDEWVANGVQKDRATEAAIRNRIFLLRNAVQGSDFEARFGRYNLPTEGGAESEAALIRHKKSSKPAEEPSSGPKAAVDMFALLAETNKETNI